MKSKKEQLALLLRKHAQQEWSTETGIEGVRIYRTDHPTELKSAIYRPNVIIVGQGAKRAYINDQALTYDAQNYLILSAPLPLDSQVITASPERPFLSLMINVDIPIIRELILDLDDDQLKPGSTQTSISSSQVTEQLLDATLRLMNSLDNERDCKVLGPMIKREILYLMLEGEQGKYLRSIALQQGQFHRISRVIQQIHMEYNQDFDVTGMAEMANMSPSTFHLNFKAATSLSPLQYLKKIRLHQARDLMIQQGLNASEAAYEVGYQSTSQFSREFKRLFGLPPTEEVARFF